MKKLMLLLVALFSVFPLTGQDAQFYFEQGNVFFNEWEPVLAVEAFSKAIELDPNNALYYIARGDIYKEGLLDDDRAIEDYTSAIALDPNNPS